MTLLGVAISTINSDWLWFSLFGSLITIAGLLLISSPLFVKGIYISNASAFCFAELDNVGKTMVTNEEDRKIGKKCYQVSLLPLSALPLGILGI